MVNTKLILIEGVPCSGKSTTAANLNTAINGCGIRSQCFLEWANNSPIIIGSMENLSEIIWTTKSREQNVQQQWKHFVKKAKQQEKINIIESRFWQTEGMYLYLSGHSEKEIIVSNRRVISIIFELNPVLIYLAPQNIEEMLTRISEEKNIKWRASGRESSWEQWGNDVYERQKWFTDRSLKGHKAIVRFFNEWVLIADKLYEEVPFLKIKIDNPQVDWELTVDKIRNFLELNR